MPRYFFDIHDGIEFRDDIGRQLEGGDILRLEALRVATTLLAAESAESREMTLVLTVRDESGGTAMRIRLVCQVEEP